MIIQEPDNGNVCNIPQLTDAGGHYGDDDDRRAAMIRVSHFMCLIPCLVLLYNLIFVLPNWNNVFDYKTSGVLFWMFVWMIVSCSIAFCIPKRRD